MSDLAWLGRSSSRSESAGPCPRRTERVEPGAVMRCREVECRSNRDNPTRIQLAMAAVVVALDVIEIHSRGDARDLEEIAKVVREIWIVLDPAQIAFEVAVIDGVEADERREQTPIGFGDASANEITLTGERLLQAIERGEQVAERLFVGFLAGRKAGAVNAIVHVLVDERVYLIDRRPQVLGVVVVANRRERVEGRIEHADDFGRTRCSRSSSSACPKGSER